MLVLVLARAYLVRFIAHCILSKPSNGATDDALQARRRLAMFQLSSLAAWQNAKMLGGNPNQHAHSGLAPEINQAAIIACGGISKSIAPIAVQELILDVHHHE